jgi:hypothetical protein
MADDCDRCLAVYSAIRNLSCANAKIFSTIDNRSVCDKYVSAITRFQHDASLIETAFWGIANLCCNQDLAMKFASIGAASVIIKTSQRFQASLMTNADQMKGYLSYGPIAEASLWVIRNFASGGTSNQTSLLEAEAFHLLNDIMTIYMDREGMVELSFDCLVNLVLENDACQDAIFSSGILSTTVTAIHMHEHISDTLEIAFKFISVISSGVYECNRQVLIDSNVLQAVIKALFNHRGYSDFFRIGCDVVLNLYYTTAEQRNQLIAKELVNAETMRALPPHGTFVGMVESWGLLAIAQELGVEVSMESKESQPQVEIESLDPSSILAALNSTSSKPSL